MSGISSNNSETVTFRALAINILRLTGKVRGNYTSSSHHVNCRGYVGSHEIFNFYEDVVSGATKERKALDQLMEDAKHRKFDGVLV